MAYLKVAEHPDRDDPIVGVRITTTKPVSLKTLKALVAWAKAQGCTED